MSKNNYAEGKIIIGNWKMNPQTVLEAKHIIAKTKNIVRKLERTTVVICPPFPFIPFAIVRKSARTGNKSANKSSTRNVKSNEVKAGAQNVFPEAEGAFTGEVSARELVDLGVEYVIVGHSERRIGGNAGSVETDMDVSRKTAAVVQAGMTVVLCIGEKTRDDLGEYLDVVRDEIKASLQAFPKRALGQLIIAYEPIWAVGAKAAMTPATIHEMVIFIKKVLSDIYGQASAVEVPILYGGSVNFRNAADIIALGQVDGLLVGRESVNVPGFVELLKTVDGIGAEKR
jgi:triosephosphate isomerase